VFRRTPFAMLEIFVLMAQQPEIKGVRADTIRLLRENRHLIDDDFRTTSATPACSSSCSSARSASTATCGG
jgi:UTP:GlnB (protein PII) uridylyltransferase